MVNSVAFTVNFRPVAWKRPVGKAMRYDSQVNDKAAFTLKAIAELNKQGHLACVNEPRPWFPKGVPVAVSIVAQHQEVKKKATDLPDIDNLAKFVLDALQSQYLDGVIWNDDAQVCTLTVSKVVGSSDAINVRIERLES